MPQVAVGAALSAVISGSIAAGALAISWTTFAGSLILGGLSYALTPKPKNLPNNNIGGGTVAVRQPTITRKHVYGHTRTVAGYAHLESTGVNGTLHMILMLCEGPVRAINEIWVNDYCVPNDAIDANGNVISGRYANYMTIRKHLGEPDQAADASAVANMSAWTANHRLQGIAYLYITLKKNQDIYPTGIPNITAIVEGPALNDPRVGTTRWNTNIALMARDYLRNNRYGFGVVAADIDETNVAAQANICDEIVDTDTLDHTITLVVPGTDLLTLNGDILKFQYGDRVQLISPGTPPGGLSTGTDYYIIPYQVKDSPRVYLASSFENAMAKVFINITSTGSGALTLRKTGEPRYHGAGVIDTETQLSQNLNGLVSGMAGRAVNIGGFWTLLAGAYRSPAIALGIEDVRGSGFGVKNSLSMSESYNEVKGVFVSPVNFYQDSDYPSAVYQQFIDDDNGLLSTKELNLPFTNRPTTAQRIAKIELFRGRQGLVVSSDFSLKALQVQPGDTIELTVDRYGFNAKEFEITEFSFDVADGNIVTKLTLRETAQEIYDWSEGEAITYDPAPNTELPNPFVVTVPTGVGYNSRPVSTIDGDGVYWMQLQWDQHPNAMVTEFGDFELQFKLSSASEWQPSWFVDGKIMQTDLMQSSIGVPYDLRIRARNNLGVRSNWVTIVGAVVGSSGGVGTTDDWELFTDVIGTYKNWETFSDAVGPTEDWGYFT